MDHMDTLTCVGPLLWWDVPAGDSAGDPAALIECCACGAIFVTGAPLDHRHHDTLVTRPDDQ